MDTHLKHSNNVVQNSLRQQGISNIYIYVHIYIIYISNIYYVYIYIFIEGSLNRNFRQYGELKSRCIAQQ